MNRYSLLILLVLLAVASLAAEPTPPPTVRPRKTDPESSPIPGHKYYKLEGDFFILGTIDNSGAFIPDEKSKPIDIRKAGSLHHPWLPGTFSKDWKHTIINEDGSEIEQFWDAKTHEYRETYKPKK